jgi:hypothetical protein
VARAREVQAISTLDYSRALLPPLETSVDRIYVVNSAQIAYGTLNVNETLALAERQGTALASHLRRRAGTAGTPSSADPGESESTGPAISANGGRPVGRPYQAVAAS